MPSHPTQSPVTVRRVDPQDTAGIDTVLDLDMLVWADPQRVPRDVQLQHTPRRAAFLATRGDEPAGICASWDVELAVPASGGSASLRPVEGLTWVGVHPDHRRSGVLSAMMRHHLRWTREEQGRPIAVLKASEPSIYGRFGYGVASTSMMSTFDRGTDFAAPQGVRDLADATTTRTTTATPEDAERVHALLRAAAATTAGPIVRSLEDLTRILTDIPQERQDREPARLIWATREGRDVGVACAHRTPKWTGGRAEGRVGVFFLESLDAGARLALARRVTDMDLMSTTELWVTPDDPLALWHPSLRPLGGAMTDDLWLRVVDLPTAVAERGHAADLDLVVEVRDEIIGEQAGRWRWSARDGVGECVAADAAPDLSLDVRDLGSVWLGGQTLAARAAAGFVTEHHPGAVRELDAALATPTQPAGAMDF